MKSEVEKQAEEILDFYNEVNERRKQRRAILLSLLKTAKKRLPHTDELVVITLDDEGVTHIDADLNDHRLVVLLELVKHKLIHNITRGEL